MTASRYRKKPVEIEAMRFDGTNYDAIAEWVGDAVPTDEGKITIRTLEGDIFAAPGDWIIRGVQGEHYPIKDAIFRETYEEVEDAAR